MFFSSLYYLYRKNIVGVTFYCCKIYKARPLRRCREYLKITSVQLARSCRISSKHPFYIASVFYPLVHLALQAAHGICLSLFLSYSCILQDCFSIDAHISESLTFSRRFSGMPKQCRRFTYAHVQILFGGLQLELVTYVNGFAQLRRHNRKYRVSRTFTGIMRK